MPANGTEYTVFEFTLPLAYPANIAIMFSAKNAYSNTSIGAGYTWYATCYVDGTLNNITGGSGAITDSISLIGAGNNLAAGNHDIKITWSGHTNMRLEGAAMNTIVTYR